MSQTDVTPRSITTPWGDLSKDTIIKFTLLACAFFVVICCYWIFKSLKDPIFSRLVGMQHQPTAKVATMVFIFPLLIVFSKMVDTFPKQRLFLFFSSVYSCLIVGFSYVYWLHTQDAFAFPQMIGWTSYVVFESFGSIMVALFWGFTTGEATAEEGKKCFPAILTFAQIGAFVGPTFVTYSDRFGIPAILFGSGLSVLLIPTIIYIYLAKGFQSQKGARDDLMIDDSPKPKTGIFEGLKLVFRDKYVAGIFGISTLHEIVVTILDFQMKFTASQFYAKDTEQFAVFMGQFGQLVNVGTVLCTLGGSSFLLRRLGLRFCLLLFPSFAFLVVGMTFLKPDLWVFFFSLAIYRVCNYAVNNPSKEVLYTPTNSDVRFKAKSWIDGFGARTAKAFGSAVNTSLKSSMAGLNYFGSMISFGVILIWISSALVASRKFRELQTSKS